MKSLAPLIAIEGADRLGKQTQSDLLLAQLRQRNLRVTCEEVPWKGHNATYDTIYEFLRDGRALEHPVIFQTLQGVNRREMLEGYLDTLRKHQDLILLDRWTPSTWVYGTISGVTEDQTKAILNGVPDPDLVIVLDGESFAMDKEKDSYEADVELQAKVRKGYLKWAQENGGHIVNANRDRHEVSRDILDVVLEFLDGR